jgi:hypothetical protein
MIRLRAAGVPVTWQWVLATYLIAALAIVAIWAGPLLRRRRGCGTRELPATGNHAGANPNAGG